MFITARTKAKILLSAKCQTYRGKKNGKTKISALYKVGVKMD